MNSAVEEIKSRLNIIDVVGEYIRLNKAGANWKACCPFHNEKTPSFTVSEEKQIWHCFGCGKGGDVFGFLMELEGLEFKEVLKMLADKSGIQLPEYNPQKANSKNKTLEILELAVKFYEKQLWDGPGKDKILQYLHKRGLKDESIREFSLGYAPSGWRNILEFLTQRGYKIEDINQTGLLVEKNPKSQTPNFKQVPNPNNQNSKITSYELLVTGYYDRFRDRIIFPIADPMGKVIGFSARVVPGGDESQAKYVNTPETVAYHKSKALYGVDKAKSEIKNKNFTLLVEGNTDVIAASQAGLKNTVAVSGTALTSDQLDILKRYSENIKMLFDMDEAGGQATLKSAQAAFQKEFDVYVTELSEGKDAAEVAVKDPGRLLQAVEKSLPAMEYFFKQVFEKYDKTKAQDKKVIAKELLNIISNLANEIEKTHWIKKLARELEVEEKVLLDILNRDRRAERRGVLKEDGQEKAAPKKRSEVIREKIIGLMLADSNVWKKMIGKNQGDIAAFLKEDELFNMLTDKGEQVEFNYNNIFPEIEDKEIGDRARKLHFDTKYHFDIQQGIKENDEEDNWPLTEQYVGEIKKEICKKRLETISRDIKKAEESGDKEAVNFLMKEFSEISRDLT